MRGSLARWRVALRIAGRGARISWGRSLLIVLLIAVPITGLSGAAVLLRSTQSTLAERVQYQLGDAQARIQVVGGPGDHVRQGVEGGYDYLSDPSTSDQRRIDPRTVLPAGARVLVVASGAATFRAPAGDVSLMVTTGRTWDPVLSGPYALLSGRRPSSADEVLLTPDALTRLGAHVGGTIRMTGSDARTLTVVGTERDSDDVRSAQTVFGASALLPAAERPVDAATYFVAGPPIDWATVQRLNGAGSTVFSREVVMHPPTLPADRQFGGGIGNPSTWTVVALAIVFAIFEVALLAGAAFLVGARLQQRMLATIASVGADRSVLRRVVTAGGVVLGATGGVAGVGLGIVGALLVMRFTDVGPWHQYPGVHLDWPVLAGIAVFGVLVGWLAALVPARAAARFDVVRALRGARTPQRVGRRPVLGIVLLAAGVVLTLLGGGALLAAVKATGRLRDETAFGALGLLGGGSLLAQIGVLLCAGLVLRGIAHLLRRAPLAARLAARDTSRNLGRAVPAVASVMTTMFIAAFAMCVANAASIDAANHYGWDAARPGLAVGMLAASGSASPTTRTASATAAIMRRDLPVDSLGLLSTTQEGTDEATPSNRRRDALPQVRFPSSTGACSDRQSLDRADLRCGPFTASGGHASQAQWFVTVGDETALALDLGHAPSAAALQALRSGGAVALRGDIAPGGTTSIDWFTPKQLTQDSTGAPVRTTRLAAVVDLPVDPVSDSLFVSPATAKRLGLRTIPEQLLLSFTRTPTQAEIDTTNNALGALANTPDNQFLRIEQGPQDYGSQIAWWVLLGCLVIAVAAGATAIGLARVDGRADDLTLASLGAGKRIRKSVAFVQALVVCGTGAVIGTLLGLLPAVAIGQASVSYAFAPPMPQLVLVAAGIPLVIAIGSWLLVGTRRGDLTRRTAIA